MNISFPPDLEAYIDAKVASGEYAHASEAVRDCVRLTMRQEAEKLAWLRKAVAEGLASPDDGELSERELEKIMADARAEFRGRRSGKLMGA